MQIISADATALIGGLSYGKAIGHITVPHVITRHEDPDAPKSWCFWVYSVKDYYIVTLQPFINCNCLGGVKFEKQQPRIIRIKSVRIIHHSCSNQLYICFRAAFPKAHVVWDALSFGT